MKYLSLSFLTIIGIGAFAISFFLEYAFFMSITNTPEFALSVTLVLECAKVLIIVFHRLVDDIKEYRIPDSVNTFNILFKSGLLLLSITCSVAIISKDLNRPNLEKVREKDKSFIEEQYGDNLNLLTNQRDDKFQKITDEIKEKYKKRYDELGNYYEPRIETEEKARDMEFENEINGVRKGVRWSEHDRKVKELTSEYKEEKQKLQDSENDELNSYMSSIQNEFQTKIDALNQENNEKLSALETNTYDDDKRVENEVVSAFLRTLEEGLDLKLEYLTFTLLFSILISVLLELTIYLTFNYVVMFQQNVISDSPEISRSKKPEHEYSNDSAGRNNESMWNNSGPSAAPKYTDNYQFQDDINDEPDINFDDFFNPNSADDNDDSIPCA